MKKLLRVSLWVLIVLLALPVLFFAYLNYVIYSFDTETLPENYGQVETKFFPAEGTDRPLIVAFGGAEGGNAWAGPHAQKQRALLEENGYSLLSVAYFGAEGTPLTLDRISIDGVHAAVEKVAQNQMVNQDCIALMGVSRGSELALLLGSYYDEYRAVVGIVPGSAVFAAHNEAMTTPAFSYKDESLPFVPVSWAAAPALMTGDLRRAFEVMMEDKAAMNKAAIQVENIDGPVLLVSSRFDEMWPSMEMSETMMQRLSDNQFAYHSQHIALDGGHSEHHDHFDKVIDFLNQNLMTLPGCQNAVASSVD